MKMKSLTAWLSAMASIALSWAGVAGASESSVGAQTAAALNRSTEGLIEHRMPDGTVHMHLAGRFRHATFARVDESGRVVSTCTADLDHAELLVSEALPAPEPKRTLPLLTPAVMPPKGQQR